LETAEVRYVFPFQMIGDDQPSPGIATFQATFLSAAQVVALFRDFLAVGKVAAFEVLRCEGDGGLTALAHSRAAIVDREGRSSRIGLHLALELEDGRWVLREVKETAP
jgi:hypothetical protein